MLLVSWRRWTSLLVDTGREMDLPLRLLRGELLYRDIHYLYPPLSPYLNALLYKLFGVRLEVLNISGVICSLLVVALCYCIARRILQEGEATLATMAVVVWCIFKPEGNLIAPYAFSALHGLILSLATLLITLRYGERRQWAEVLWAGILIGIAGITKQEFALTAAVTWSAGVLFVHRRIWQELCVRLLVPGVIAIAIAAPVYGYFLWRVGWTTLIDDCHLLYTGIPASLKFYNAARTGLDHPWSSLLQMLGGVSVSVGLASLILILASFASQNWRKRLHMLVIVIASISVALAIKTLSLGRWDGSPLRALPFALLALMTLHFFRRDETKPQMALFVIAVYSLLALIRVVLRVPSGGAFGGYFLPTSLILIVYLVVNAWPRFVLLWGFPDHIGHRVRTIGYVVLSVWLVSTMIVFGYRYHKTFPVLLTTPNGNLYVTRDNALAAREALDFLAVNTTPMDSIAVLPEGSSLAFLAGRSMPLRHQILIPDFMDAAEEQRAIAKLAEVKYVLLLNRPMREFGLEAFGRDYYQAMGSYLDKHFQIVKVCGENKDEYQQIGAPQFFIKILGRIS